MKLYDTRTAPNPRRVRVFLAEKGIEIPHVQQIDLGKLEQKGEEFTPHQSGSTNPGARA